MNPAQANRAQVGAGRPGYEAWYVTVNQPSRQRGFWLRYTRFQPGPRSKVEPHSALWAFSFDREKPGLNRAGKDVHPLSALEMRDPFSVRLDEAELTVDGCRGRAGEISWDLGWKNADPAASFPFPKPPWQRLSMVANHGVQLRLLLTGTIQVGGERHLLQGEPGGQQHTWGRSHAFSWNWGYASGDWGWVDGATSRVPSRFGRTLAGTALGANLNGEEVRVNSMLGLLRNPGTIAPDGWRAAAGGAGVAIVARREDLVGVTYDDPAGDRRVCYHTEVADLELSLGGETVRQTAAAAFEFASRGPLPGLPPVI